MGGVLREILLLDSFPFTLGVRIKGDEIIPVIERNTYIPTKKFVVFSTSEDNQTAVEIEIWTGMDEKSPDNRKLGTLCLDGIPPAPRGVPQIEVGFGIHADGILIVSAHDKATGREKQISIEFGVRGGYVPTIDEEIAKRPAGKLEIALPSDEKEGKSK